MDQIKLIQHRKGAPLLRIFGIGNKVTIFDGITQIQNLLENNTFWATGRSKSQICKMLSNSTVVVSAWHKNQLIGFGRATSDHVFRAVLWDVVIDSERQGLGLGKLIVEALLKNKEIECVEKVYLMTTNSSEFYKQLGFKINNKQSLLMLNTNEA